MIGAAKGLALVKMGVELWKGKPAQADNRLGYIEATKGLKGSRTVKTEATILALKVGGAFAMPVPTWLQYAIVGAFFAEFIVQLYLRVITRGPV